MQPRAAFIPLARTTFDLPLAEQVTQAGRAFLEEAGFELIGPDHLVTDAAAAQAAADGLRGEAVDVLIIFQSTFADSTMVTALVEASSAPVFLWAIPEAREGGRLRLNSLCGINLAGHALTLHGRSYQYAYAAPGDRDVARQLRELAGAGMVVRRLKNARLGVVGEHPAGMDSCHLDAPLLHQRLGITIEQIALDEVFDRARSLATTSQVSEARALIEQRIDNLADLDQAPLMGTLSVYAALKAIAAEQHLDGLAVRCWPEFFTQMGCAGCGAMSMLSDGLEQAAPIPCSCEADINGTVTQLMLQWLASAPAFGTDIVAMDFDDDVIALWHCGLAPLSMADPDVRPQGGIHSNRKVPLVFDFPLRPGPVTIARLSQSPGSAAPAAPDGVMRLVVGRGEMLAAPKPFAGTSGTLRLENSTRSFFDKLMQEGLEHHISLAYGEYFNSLVAAGDLLNLPVLKL